MWEVRKMEKDKIWIIIFCIMMPLGVLISGLGKLFFDNSLIIIAGLFMSISGVFLLFMMAFNMDKEENWCIGNANRGK